LFILLMLTQPGPDRSYGFTSSKITRNQLGWITIPFVAVYLILIAKSGQAFFDRYSLSLLVVLLIWLLHLFHDRVSGELPRAAFLLIVPFAVYAVACTHNQFAVHRALLDLVHELREAGVPDTMVNNGWEYNMDAELRYAPNVNDYRIDIPADAYKPQPHLDDGTCITVFASESPHIHPIYSVSYDPNACGGPAGFAPVHYSRWLASPQGTLYVVRRK
jgi:hypothetical protein